VSVSIPVVFVAAADVDDDVFTRRVVWVGSKERLE
jgi:hypothetical protein